MENILETKRLIIRCFRDEDAQKLYENHLEDEDRKLVPRGRTSLDCNI